MNSFKCSYTILSSLGSKNKDRFNLKLKVGVKSYNNYPVFLGITFDEYLNFKCHTENLETRAKYYQIFFE